MSFSELGLSPELLRAIGEANYATPTPVQAAAIAPILRGRDVRARAQTGSGKTAAFALPMLQRLQGRPAASDRQVSGLVLVPTRELASQVGESFRILGRYLPQPVKVLTVFGGVSINPQMMALRGGADIVVATPGRLLDLADHNAVHLSEVSTLVLDEADRLLDEGFADELTRVLALLPDRRQNLLFSATFPSAVQSLAELLLREPIRIEVAATVETSPSIQQRSIAVDPERRTQLLRYLIQHHGWERTLVFVATKYATEHIALKLQRLGFTAGALHGDLSQGARTQALADFKAGRLQVLIATDVAARGIDVIDLPAVVNFDLPRSADDYVHRIGRTGRAGASGAAVSFVSAVTEAHFRLIEKRNGSWLEREQLPGFEPTATASTPTSPGTGGVKGTRKSKKDKLREAAARGSQVETASTARGAHVEAASTASQAEPAKSVWDEARLRVRRRDA
ncbi:MAG: DEAD/DEAH box helicase [Gammaproteobacteria bacterium]